MNTETKDTNIDLEGIAVELKTAQDECAQVQPFTDRVADFDIARGYAVADSIHRSRISEGAMPRGRKIGFTNANIWPTFGVDEPMWGYMYDHTVFHQGSEPIVCRIGHLAEPKIEPEIVFHFRDTPPVTDDVTDILACVDWVAHGFEIVQSHFPGWTFQAADTIADGGLHGLLIVGEPREIAELSPDIKTALADFSLTLWCDGLEQDNGSGANVLGSPLNAISHLIAILAKQSIAMPLQSGELVTTGTLTAAFPVAAGQRWHTEISGLPLPGLSAVFET